MDRVWKRSSLDDGTCFMKWCLRWFFIEIAVNFHNFFNNPSFIENKIIVYAWKCVLICFMSLILFNWSYKFMFLWNSPAFKLDAFRIDPIKVPICGAIYESRSIFHQIKTFIDVCHPSTNLILGLQIHWQRSYRWYLQQCLNCWRWIQTCTDGTVMCKTLRVVFEGI